jgi:hypothetical protein
MMRVSSKKLSIKTPSPKKSSGMGKLAPLKTTTYTKAGSRNDPMAFGSVGFGSTGLHQTPSLLGMGKSSKGFKL